MVFWRLPDPDTSQIMIANTDGTDVRALLDTPLTGADWYEFSPADDRLAIVHSGDNRRVLSILDMANPSALRDVPVQNLSVDNDVLWRPRSGAELVLTARPIDSSGSNIGIYAIRPDGTGFRVIAAPNGIDYAYNGIDVSPDGRLLAYWQYEPDSSPDGVSSYIHLVDLDSLVDRRVRFDPAAQDEAELHFSPDGRTAAIVRQTNLVHLAIVPIDGSSPGRIVGPPIPGDQSGRAHGFSPDGRLVVLHIDRTKPQFIDVESGVVTTGPETFGTIASWQRLAP
jgi:dipeptidyl aminopeptidase/acylaminoacyl peptidase